MNILSASWGIDVGGVSSSLVRAFARNAPGWSFRSLIRKSNYIGYPVDLPWDATDRLAAWDWADVVQLHETFATVDMLRPRSARPLVLYHHGTMFRSDPDRWLGEQRDRGALGVCSTLDLWLIAPDELEWVPPAIDIAAMEAIRAEHYRPDDVIRIAHAPTDRLIKSTDQFRAAVDRLQAEGLPVEPIVVTKVAHGECLARKATADIYVDQAILGYGVNAIECWAMGIPVVAGGEDATLDEMERRFGSLPFLHATEVTIYDALRELVLSPQLREAWGRRGRRHVEQFHVEAVVVPVLQDVYRRAAGRATARRAA